ncbi:MFS transporter [Nocardioides houyundeii]|uniref:MFS transporter n=1 Tax=Nocardioides houyundeii TaxID=2045452 RepID=UPI0013B436F4|nr:MFS transporter [Nocardioides houyundeii]
MAGAQRSDRSTWGLLTDRHFGPFLLGKTLSFTGVWIHNVVAAVLAWQLTHSATWVAIVSVAQFAPQIVLAPIAGPLADRASRARLVAYGRVFCLLGSGGLALWVWVAGYDRIEIWAVLLTTLTLGVGFAVSGPAMQAMVSDLVEPSEVGRAVALDTMPTMLGRAVGPAIGALLAAFVGPAAALAVAAGGHLAFGIIAALLSRRERPHEVSTGGGGFREGLAYVRSNPVVIFLLLGVTAVGMGADPVVTLAPAIADGLGGGQALVGFLGSAFGAGAVVGGVVSTLSGGGSRAAAAPAFGLLVLGLGLSAVPLTQTPWAVSACFGVAGLGFTIALSGCTAMLHRVVPAGVRGRVMSLWLVAFLGTRPIASVVDGVLADSFGVSTALVVLGLGVAATGVLCSPRVLTRMTR